MVEMTPKVAEEVRNIDPFQVVSIRQFLAVRTQCKHFYYVQQFRLNWMDSKTHFVSPGIASTATITVASDYL